MGEAMILVQDVTILKALAYEVFAGKRPTCQEVLTRATRMGEAGEVVKKLTRRKVSHILRNFQIFAERRNKRREMKTTCEHIKQIEELGVVHRAQADRMESDVMRSGGRSFPKSTRVSACQSRAVTKWSIFWRGGCGGTPPHPLFFYIYKVRKN
jgi:hypothetical protein